MKKSRLLPALFWRKLAGEHLSHEQLPHDRSFAHVSRRQNSNTHLHIEQLEDRMMLSISPVDYTQVSAAWFAVVPCEESASGESLIFNQVCQGTTPNASRWIVRFSEEALENINSPTETTSLLRETGISFRVVQGLGLPGQVLIEAQGASNADIEAALQANSNIAYFECDSLSHGQKTSNDTDYPIQSALDNTSDHDIDAPEAWNITTGSTEVVVGVVDTGIDYTHPDLYLNIWLNRGEIPDTLKSKIIDTDADGLITFYDLNNDLNTSNIDVTDTNGNGYIDAQDLLNDSHWANGIDEDGSGKIDDLVGWNFVNNTNNPFDDNGHGTEVSGIIGAIGNNNIGIAGVNWRTSLMSLKFLDNTNSGPLSLAAEAVNYAIMMRGLGVNVRVLNASFVNESESHTLAVEIQSAAAVDTGILVVAAAGNAANPWEEKGINIDTQPFYPASYSYDNIISVAASDSNDLLASFSNYGYNSVDLVAPGVGIRTTDLNGSYGFHNGTSMAAPFVTATAALVWSKLPYATASEVRRAILESTDSNADLQSLVARGGRLNAWGALLTDTVAPRAKFISAPDITEESFMPQVISVSYTDNVAVKVSSLDSSDLVIRRADGSGDDLAVQLHSVDFSSDGSVRTPTYYLYPSDGKWSVASNGYYDIYLLANQVRDTSYNNAKPCKLGSFKINISKDGVFRVDSFVDAVDAFLGNNQAKDALGRTTLRAAIQEANVRGNQTYIILGTGTYSLSIPGISEDSSLSGDLDIYGDVVITGISARETFIDAQELDRIFDIHPGGILTLSNITLTGGLIGDQYSGGAIRNRGTLTMTNCTVTGNVAAQSGGGLFNQGTATINNCTFNENKADSNAISTILQKGTEYLINTTDTSGTQYTPEAAMNDAGQSVVVWGSNGSTVKGRVFDTTGNVISFTVGSTVGGSITSRPASVAMDAAGNFAVAWVTSSSSYGSEIYVQLYYANGTPRSGNPLLANFSYQSGNQSDPRIVMDKDGNFVVAWVDKYGYDGNGSGIYYQCFYADGKPMGANRLANSYTTNEQTNPAMAIDAKGNFIIVWEDNVQDGSEGGIYFQLFDKYGAPKNGEKRANATTDKDQSQPSVDFDAQGNIVIAWTGEYSNFNLVRPYAAFFDSNGTAITDEIVLNSSWTLGWQTQPQVRMDAQGNLFATWVVWAKDGSNNGVYGQLFNNKGQALGDEFRVATTINLAQLEPRIVMDGQGNAIVIWSGTGQGDNAGIFAQRYIIFPDYMTDSTKEWIATGGEIRANTSTSGTQDQPKIAVNDAGYFVAVWRSFESGSYMAYWQAFDPLGNKIGASHALGHCDSSDRLVISAAMDAAGNYVFVWSGDAGIGGDGLDILVQRFKADGNPIDLSPRIVNNNQTIGDQFSPSVAIAENGSFVVSWVDGSGLNGGDLADVYYQCFSANGVFVDSNRRANSYTTSDQKTPCLSVAPNGKFVIAWVSTGQEGYASGIYFQCFNADGTPNGTETRANDITASAQDQPCVAIDSNGNIIMAWHNAGVVDRLSLRARIFASDGTIVPSFQLNTAFVDYTSLKLNPQIALDTQGNFLVSWQALHEDGKEYAILAQRFDNRGQPLGNEFLVNTSYLGPQCNPAVAMDAAGNAIIIWQGNGVGDSTGIFFQRYLHHASVVGSGGAIENEGTLSITNCTISGNTARRQGGGIFNTTGASTETVNCTIAFNDAGNSGGGIWNTNGGTVCALNTLIAGNTSTGNSPDVGGDYLSLGHNLIGQLDEATGFNASSDQSAADAANFIGQLGNNGGQTDTHELLVGSSAIDAGLNIGSLITDQRGVARPQDYLDKGVNLFDIGAVERYQGEIHGKILRVYEDDSYAGLSGMMVYLDSNKNGSFDPYEPTALTQADGSYIFSGLLPGEYFVRRIIPNGWSAISPSTDVYKLTLRTGECLNNNDFVFYGNPGEIRGTVFSDLNRDNYRQDTELGVSSWTVYIDSNDNGVLDSDENSVQTDYNGQYIYILSDLNPLQKYIIRIVSQENWLQTLPRLVDDSKWTVIINPGDVLTNIDFGVYNTFGSGVSMDGSISGVHFLDVDGDGVRDNDESGKSGWTVFLDMNNNGTLDSGEPSTVTDSNGEYTFINLENKIYNVRMVQAVESQQTAPLDNKFVTTNIGQSVGTPMDIIAADFSIEDGKGLKDLLVADQTNDCAWLMINKGGGVYDTPIKINLNFTTNQSNYSADIPSSLVAGDFNNDGKIDFAVANLYTSTVSIMINLGNCEFGRLQEPIKVGVDYSNPDSITTGDFNCDGYLDLAVANEGNGKVRILINNPASPGNFTLINTDLSTGLKPFEVLAADLNNDNKIDLAVVNLRSDSVTVFFNNGFGGFNTGSSITLESTPLPSGSAPLHKPCSLTTGDLDGDGDPDLAVANYASYDVTILLNNGSGTFTRWQNRLPAGQNPMSINSADMDGDGKIDLIVTNRSKNVSILRNNGNLNFSAPNSYGVGNFPDNIAFAAVVLDVTSDNKPDVIMANCIGSNGNGYVSVLSNSVIAGAYHVNPFGTQHIANINFGRILKTNPPTLVKIADTLPIAEDSGTQSIILTGITPGYGVSSSVSITAVSNNSGLIPNPQINYIPFATTATLSYTPVVYKSGAAEITVTVMNGGMDNNLETVLDNVSVIQKFTVRINAVNHSPTINSIPNPPRINPDASQQLITLTDITGGPGEANQPLRVMAVSSNPSLIPNPTVLYASPDLAGTLLYTPVAGQDGQAIVTIMVTDGGLDLNMDTAHDNLTTTCSFTVNVFYNPTAKNDDFTGIAANSGSVILDVLANDLVDPAGTLIIHSIGKTSNGGTVQIVNNGTRLLYTPAPGFVGTETFEYDAEKTGVPYRPYSTVSVHVVAPSITVAGRYIFYNNSFFSTEGINNSIAYDKQALLPGQQASYSNYTSYSRGINGVIIDVIGPHAAITASQFIFKIGNNNSFDSWSPATSPTNIVVLAGAGINGSDRIVITWADNVIQNKWLQVRLKSDTNTGLLHDDVFYFGNAIGESGNNATGSICDAIVDVLDEQAVHANYTVNVPAEINNQYDFNRDGSVNSNDESIAAANHSGTDPLMLILVSKPLIVSANDWTDAGLTLKRTSDGLLHLYRTGSTTDAVAPYLYYDLTGVQITGRENYSDTLTIDFSGGNPIPVCGLNFDGASGLNNLVIIGTGGNDNLIMASTQITLNGSQPMTYANVQVFNFNLMTGKDNVTVTSGTLSLGMADSISDGTNVTINGGTLDLKGQSETIADFVLKNGSVVNGTLHADFYAIENGVVTAVLTGPGSITKSTTGMASFTNINNSNTTVTAGELTANSITTGTLTIGAGAKVTIRPIVITRSWDGGGADNKWTTKENWIGDVAPQAGNNLVFPDGALRLESTNDYPASTVFGSITVSGSGYHFHAGSSTYSSVQVQADVQLVVDTIVTGTLKIGAGGKVTITPISGGPLDTLAIQTPLKQLLSADESKPLANIMPSQEAICNLAATTSNSTITEEVALADSVTEAPVYAIEIHETTVAQVPTPPFKADTVTSRPIHKARKQIQPQELIYSMINSKALHKIVDNWLDNTRALDKINNQKTSMATSLNKKWSSSVYKIEKHTDVPAIDERQVHLAALETFMQCTRWNDVDNYADFNIVRHPRNGKHIKEFEKTVDTILAEVY